MEEQIKSGIAIAEPEIEQTPIPVIRNTPYKLKTSQKVYIFFKSVFDWISALLVLVIGLPVWIILAIAIKCDSKGPAIFKHTRIGKDRKPFKCYKWRSMSINAPKHKASRDFNDADTYITKVGSFIRKTSIDEFAQIFNILTFKMSWIGYRPLCKNDEEIDKMRLERGVYQIKPGISGWAQVNGRDLVTNTHKAEYDEYYLKNISLKLDIKIFFLTLRKIFRKEDIKEGSIASNGDEKQ